MRILGIDPGTINLGYGIVDGGEPMRMVDCGSVDLSSKIPIEKRLCSFYNKLTEIIADYRPDEVAIEEPFVGLNVRSALAIGKAQAIAVLAAAIQGLPVYYYSPAQVKEQVASHGGSDKDQMREMVKIHLNLSQYPQPTSDAADALAVAICHIQKSHFDQWLATRASR